MAGASVAPDIAIAVDSKLPVSAGLLLADKLRAELLGHISALRTATITLASPDEASPFELAPIAQGPHHAPEPFIVKSKLVSGELSIVNTLEGERFRLTLTKPLRGWEVTVLIDRPSSTEKLPLQTTSDAVSLHPMSHTNSRQSSN